MKKTNTTTGFAARLGLMALVAVVAGACLSIEHQTTTTAPSQTSSLADLLGSWSSSSLVPSASTCTNFNWAVTEQTGTTASGTFSGTCAGGLTLAGTASGTLLGTTISWTANGNATGPDLPSCAFALTGNAYLENGTVRVPYTGQTCLGAVSGEEVFKR